jgi:outer membrane receptor protein involved in Fe transport
MAEAQVPLIGARRRRRAGTAFRVGCALSLGIVGTLACASAQSQDPVRAMQPDPHVTLLDRIEVTATPLPGSAVDADDLPYTVQSADAEDIAQAQAGNLTDYLLRRFNGVGGNDIQGSPFQTDITYRGFRASALPGASQGVSVYLDGVRVNEPFGDIVSWDMLPEAAVRSLVLMPGSNPLYGANTLGGALAFTTKSGLSDPGFQGDLSAGSHARRRLDASYGWSGADGGHALVATTLFDEDGWRDASPGRLGNVFAKAGGSVGELGDWSLSLLHGRSRLVGNGLVPDRRYTDAGVEPALYAEQPRAVYSSPDLTRNRNTQATLRFDQVLGEATGLHWLAYHRQGRRDTVNGDLSGDYEEYVEDCAQGFDAAGDPLSDECDFDANDGAALHTGVLNTTRTHQRAQGLGVHLDHVVRGHHLVLGATWDRNRVDYAQYEQAGSVSDAREVSADPAAERAFFSGVQGGSRALSVFASDLWQLGERSRINASLRWNHTRVENTLSTADDGEKPREAFTYTALNPALGVTHRPFDALTLFANVSQNTRAPTAIELGCADPEEPCRLPTGLQADPRLEQIVSSTLEAGLRWDSSPERSLNLSLYRAENRDDILFLRAPGTRLGYFDNVGRTRYQGADVQVLQVSTTLDWYAGYSLLDATYRSQETLLAGERTIRTRPGMRIAGLPRHTFKAGFDWRIAPEVSLGVDLQASSRRVASGNEDGWVEDPGDEEGEADADGLRHDLSTSGYAVVNMRATWTPRERLQLYARVDNIFDRRYETYAAVAEDLFPGGELARPHVAPVEEGPARFVAPGAARGFTLGMRLSW